MRFLKYSLVKPFLAGSDDWLAPLASVFSSLAAVELFAEGPGTDDVAFWRDLGMSCNWVRERPRLKNKMGMISYELVVSLAAAVSTLPSPPSQNYRTSYIRLRSLKGLWSYSYKVKRSYLPGCSFPGCCCSVPGCLGFLAGGFDNATEICLPPTWLPSNANIADDAPVWLKHEVFRTNKKISALRA